MTLTCSIVVSSYNKADYVGIAVESALSQTYPGIEVIVIDDGSRDRSPAVLREFGDRIRLELKPNGGQASAMNRGFALSSGDIVFFLDCDDVLAPDTVERVVALWKPGLSKVHFRLRRIGAEGAETGGPPMPPYGELPAGDLSGLLHRFGFYPAPPTSGNAFARRFLEKVMPIPEDVYRAWPDTYLVGSAPLFGHIGVLSGFGGSWRTTEANYSKGGLEKLEAKILGDREYIDRVGRMAVSVGDTRNIPAKWPQHLKDRLIIAKFGKATGRRNQAAILRDYLLTVWAWPEYNIAVRARFIVWALLLCVVPAALLRLMPGVAGPNVRLA